MAPVRALVRRLHLLKPALDLSVSSHSGTMASIFRVVGHRDYAVNPGGVVPVLIRAKQRKATVA